MFTIFYLLTEIGHGAHKRLEVTQERDSLLAWTNYAGVFLARAVVLSRQREEPDQATFYKAK